MSDFRKRVLGPALIPFGAFAFIGALAYAASRILLAVTTEGSVIVAILLAGCVLFAAAAVAKAGTLKQVQRIGLIAFSLLLLGGGIGVEAALGPREVEKHAELAATLVAQNIKFDKTEFAVPSGEPFLLGLDNRDAVDHNISIYTEQGGDQLYTFAPFTGPAKREFPSGKEGIPGGLYYFQCDVHPAMRGTVTAGEATGGAATPPPPASPSPGASAPSSPSPGAAPSGPISLVANNLRFDKSQLSFPAGTQVTIDFRIDEVQPHNWALYAEQTYATVIYQGEIFTGPGERKYVFPAPAVAGTYYFKCDVHPTMTGTATVT